VEDIVSLFEGRKVTGRQRRRARKAIPAELSDEEVRVRLQEALDALRANVEAVYRHIVLRGPL
jgi:hypothetical protein